MPVIPTLEMRTVWHASRFRPVRAVLIVASIVVAGLVVGSGSAQAYHGRSDEHVVEHVANGMAGVSFRSDSGATCERVPNRRKYACSVLKGPEDSATGLLFTCSRPVYVTTAPCSVRRMTARERCRYGVLSGIPFTPTFDEEKQRCRRLGFNY